VLRGLNVRGPGVEYAIVLLEGVEGKSIRVKCRNRFERRGRQEKVAKVGIASLIKKKDLISRESKVGPMRCYVEA
jgi:hypothetical protein